MVYILYTFTPFLTGSISGRPHHPPGQQPRPPPYIVINENTKPRLRSTNRCEPPHSRHQIKHAAARSYSPCTLIPAHVVILGLQLPILLELLKKTALLPVLVVCPGLQLPVLIELLNKSMLLPVRDKSPCFFNRPLLIKPLNKSMLLPVLVDFP